MRTRLKDRDEIAGWMVSIWRDAISLKFEWPVLMAKFTRVRESKDYKKLTQRERQYVEGYNQCYSREVVTRQYTESGSWVTMPDGTTQYFGVRERLGLGTEKLKELYPTLVEHGIHRYIHEHQIPELSGIYWIGRDGVWDGKFPHFIPAIHFTPKMVIDE